jgi:hypothetical protein
VLLALSGIDLAAVAVLGWLLWRGERLRAAVLEDQQQALGRLKGDLAQLLEDAEQRAATLEERLGERERSLRALVARLGPSEARQEARPQAAKPLTRTVIEDLVDEEDPAEARLLRDLELSLGRGRAA